MLLAHCICLAQLGEEHSNLYQNNDNPLVVMVFVCTPMLISVSVSESAYSFVSLCARMCLPVLLDDYTTVQKAITLPAPPQFDAAAASVDFKEGPGWSSNWSTQRKWGETDEEQERKGICVWVKTLNMEEWRCAIIAVEWGNLLELNSVGSTKVGL